MTAPKIFHQGSAERQENELIPCSDLKRKIHSVFGNKSVQKKHKYKIRILQKSGTGILTASTPV
jgi:hypothetical protein